jgi:hypothetical protein
MSACGGGPTMDSFSTVLCEGGRSGIIFEKGRRCVVVTLARDAVGRRERMSTHRQNYCTYPEPER